MLQLRSCSSSALQQQIHLPSHLDCFRWFKEARDAFERTFGYEYFGNYLEGEGVSFQEEFQAVLSTIVSSLLKGLVR